MFNLIKQQVPATDAVHVAFPVGCLMDIPTGTFHRGFRGNWIMSGGYADIDSVVGPGHTWKTEQALYPILTILGHIPSAGALIYDTENSLTYERVELRRPFYEGLENFDLRKEQYEESPRFYLTSSAKIDGDEFFEIVKGFAKVRQKEAKKQKKMTPFLDPMGEHHYAFPPGMFAIDSLSGMSISAVHENIMEKNNVGEGGANVVFMKDGAAKTQLLIQLPNLPARAGIHVSMTAHVGSFIQMDQYAPKPITLTHSKNGTKHKGVPEKFSFYNTHLKDTYSATVLKNKTTKAPEYPDGEADKSPNTDLMLITVVNSRNKNGPTGVTMPIVVSQREGVIPSLTEFNYIKNVGVAGTKKFGFLGNDQNYQLALCPDIKLSRTTVRPKLRANRELRVAAKLMADLLQMKLLWDTSNDLWCTPEELYEDIKNMGYDWNILLKSRYWWCFVDEEDQQPANELTIMDLLKMRKGEYHPYWLEDDKRTVKKEFMKPIYA
ncbi:UvsX protein [Vibrio phage BONAISHI]|nr:UvsX protein [Vibrio phage BONAISHI]